MAHQHNKVYTFTHFYLLLLSDVTFCFLDLGETSSFGAGGGLETTGSGFEPREMKSSATLEGSALQTNSSSQLGLGDGTVP